MLTINRRSLLGAAAIPVAAFAPATTGSPQASAPQQPVATVAVSAVQSVSDGCQTRYRQRTQHRYVRGVFDRSRVSRRAQRRMMRMERCAHSPRARGNMRRARLAQVRIRKREQAIPPVLYAIARCESGGDPSAVSSGGTYRGLLQFDMQTWASVGGEGDPARASAAEQYWRGAILYRLRGGAPWPVCSR